MKITFTKSAWEDYLWFQQNDRKRLKRINVLIKDTIKNPFEDWVNPNLSNLIYQDIGPAELHPNTG